MLERGGDIAACVLPFNHATSVHLCFTLVSFFCTLWKEEGPPRLCRVLLLPPPVKTCVILCRIYIHNRAGKKKKNYTCGYLAEINPRIYYCSCLHSNATGWLQQKQPRQIQDSHYMHTVSPFFSPACIGCSRTGPLTYLFSSCRTLKTILLFRLEVAGNCHRLFKNSASFAFFQILFLWKMER